MPKGEKQAIFKELPRGKWDNDIWKEVVKTQANKKIEFEMHRQYEERENEKLRLFQLSLRETHQRVKTAENKELRRREMEEFQRNLEKQKNNKYNLPFNTSSSRPGTALENVIETSSLISHYSGKAVLSNSLERNSSNQSVGSSPSVNNSGMNSFR
jgi:ATPase subunit of ABC transporter with duplicated ATPase domains